MNMKTIFLKTIMITALLGFLVPAFAFAQGPGIPHQFFGAAQFASGATPNGLSVQAKINGVVVGSSVTANGNYGYNPNLLFVTDNQNTNAGKIIEFYVSGIKANETAIFTNGNSTQLNLTVPAPAPTSGPTPTPTPTPSPAPVSGGGGSYTPPLALIKGDINNDKKVDKYDFSLMMANWGKIGSNTSDLNNDGKVDKYDFALLMLNWSK